MHTLYERIVQAAANETVIIYGETGTGKELAVHTIFQLSHQHTAEFITVNCGAHQEALFEDETFGKRMVTVVPACSDDVMLILPSWVSAISRAE